MKLSGFGARTSLLFLCAVAGLLLAVAPALPPGARAGVGERGEILRVGLATGAAALRLGAAGPFRLVDPSGREVFSGVGSEVEVRWEGGGALLGPAPGQPAALPLLVDAGEEGIVTLGGRPYRGQLQVLAGPAGLTAVNLVALEDYLLGVVPREMPADWPAEALKAQAVAARTYALYVRQSGKHAPEGFHLCATQDCQVYGGVWGEDPRARAAVEATQGEVLRYGGELVMAFFHSSSGGHTENAENVWGSYLPYLRGVPDFDQASPHSRWELGMTLQEVEAALRAGGVEVGRLQDFEAAGEPGVSGRPCWIRLSGTAGTSDIRSSLFRKLLGLKSTLFSVRVEEARLEEVLRPRRAWEGTWVAPAADVGAAPKARLLGTYSVPVAVGASGQGCRVPEFYALGRQPVPARVTFLGRGWGHGVGMSQWGARALAQERGYTYRQILEYYYTGARVE
ncbi:MAG: SpoIID/LytB domain-containing protein [Acetobacteraceae bacterium]|nr:SpoIID/LytB domain-containing protein [Acetobacteraceae bacterium]